MTLYKAMVVFQGTSNIPEDRFVNTFHFNMAGVIGDVAPALSSDLAAFYNTAVSTVSIAGCMPSFVSRSATTRVYDMSTAEPRVPTIVPWTLGAATGDLPLPEEVAVCCSFYGQPPVTPRRRGRIYLGPLNGAIISNTTGGTKVAAAFRTTVTTRAKVLADSNTDWCIFSPTDGSTVTVRGGYCDDGFDTMRKRGPKTTARTVWAAA